MDWSQAWPIFAFGLSIAVGWGFCIWGLSYMLSPQRITQAFTDSD